MSQIAFDAKHELQVLAAKIRVLRHGGGRLELSQDTKMRLHRIWQAGISGADIRRATGVQLVQIKNWMRGDSVIGNQTKRFRILTVANSFDQAQPLQQTPNATQTAEQASGVPIVFRFSRSGNSIELSPSHLTKELLGLLSQC